MSELWDYVRIGTPLHPVPFTGGDRYFYLRQEGLQAQPVLHVQEGLSGEPRALLDPNALSLDGTVALSSLDVTPDGALVAYGLTDGGSDWQEIRVRDVSTGTDLTDRVSWVKFSSPSWTHDGRGFYYSRYPEPREGERLLEANRRHQLCYHRLGTEQSEDVLVLERRDHPEWGFQASVSEDGRYVLIHVWHGTAPENRLYVQDLGDPERPSVSARVRPILDRGDASYVSIGNEGARLFLLTDREAPRKRVVSLDLDAPGTPSLQEVVPEQTHVLEGASLLGGRLVLSYLDDAKASLRQYTLSGDRLPDELTLPGPASVAGVSGKYGRTEIFVAFSSFLHPTSILRHELDSGSTEAFMRPSLDFDPSAFETSQEFFDSRDGTRVPMFVVHRRGLRRDGSHPALLYGYGGFNVSLTPFFSIPHAVWLEMGGVLAVPNLRGGGEYGEDWHRAGTKEQKQNVFDDFLAAAEHLVESGYTRAGRIAIAGASNGGLLVGASIIQRPDLFGAALPSVGVMDMLRFHLFTIGWAWASDYGSSEDPEGFHYLYAYSPLHNVEDGGCYPATLITTADHDDRVVPGHSFKFAARLQEAQGCDKPVLIRVDVRAGHGAGKPTRMLIDEATDRLAFAWWHLTSGSE
jgi:prolyl oligopeptidase